MAFFKNLLTSIKNAFGGEDNEQQEMGLAKQRDTISSYQHATTPQPAKTEPSPTQPKQSLASMHQAQQTVKAPVEFTEDRKSVV